MTIRSFFSDEKSEKKRKPKLSFLFHRATCVVSVLNIAYWFLMCILSAGNALQDIEKYSGLRASQPFWQYLGSYYFLECILFFLILAIELFVYITKSRRAMKTSSHTGNILYFAVILLFHVGVWLYLHVLTAGYVLPFTDREERMVFYRTFADDAILPTVMFLIAYILRVIIPKSQHNK